MKKEHKSEKKRKKYHIVERGKKRGEKGGKKKKKIGSFSLIERVILSAGLFKVSAFDSGVKRNLRSRHANLLCIVSN